MLKGRNKWTPSLYSELSTARAWLPGIGDYAHNKYGSVSYWSAVFDLNYRPSYRPLQGLVFRLLYVAKVSPGEDVPVNKMFYSTNYQQVNFVTQVSF
ncbi:hypothetical protein [Pontibacter harenae]|uniref:hypothetical protein n=1 Tax=Pontibacter harenae TaxID=2894083 RepID=UPI001E56219E|nr:hypothetical protein [Pontibacter harenae]MCC9169000.1 hypothetical protein [Pontibacter harenae]